MPPKIKTFEEIMKKLNETTERREVCFKNILWQKPLEFLGEISYSIYILQVPVYTFGISVLKRLGITNSISVFFILMVVLIIVSMLSYLWIEKPFRREKTCSKGSLEKSLLT